MISKAENPTPNFLRGIALTKALHVARKLRHSIARGAWGSGSPLPPERELELRFGVSRTTIRDALNTLAQDGLLDRRKGAGTFVASSATKTCVGVLASVEFYNNTSSYYSHVLVEEITACLKAAGYEATFLLGRGRTVKEFAGSIHLLDRAVTSKLAGIISLIDMSEFSEYLNSIGLRNVSIVAGIQASDHAVLLDYKPTFQLIHQQLAAHQISDFALMYTGPFQEHRDQPWYLDQLSVYQSLCPNLDNLIEVEKTWDHRYAYDTFKQWWAREDRPAAIVFTDDALCTVASRAFLELGIRIPEDLKVITINNKGHTFQLPYVLTSVGWDLAEVARAAWEKLDRLIRGRPDQQSVSLPPRLFPGISLGEEAQD